MCLCQICLYSFDKRIMRGVVHLLVTNILVLFIIIEINTTALNNILFSAFLSLMLGLILFVIQKQINTNKKIYINI